jgi:D-beta-D-heptose 7-phosphate kinase/D-beta-D-heptose 1-phosphate adenosyltransferase
MTKNSFLIIGESCVDVFIYGSSNRLSPEAPVPVFVPFETTKSNGMAANVCENLKSLIIKNEIPHTIIFEVYSDFAPMKTRFVDKKSNHLFLRVDEGDNQIERIVVDKILQKMIKSADTIIISDYNKGFLHEEDIIKILSYTNLTKQTIFLDTKKILSKKILEKLSFVKLNFDEFENNFKKDYDLLDTYDEKVIVTKGGDGAYYMGNEYKLEEQSQTIDVSGAGDTFLAALAFYYSKDETIEDSIKFANKMASEVVKKRGVSII